MTNTPHEIVDIFRGVKASWLKQILENLGIQLLEKPKSKSPANYICLNPSLSPLNQDLGDTFF